MSIEYFKAFMIVGLFTIALNFVLTLIIGYSRVLTITISVVAAILFSVGFYGIYSKGDFWHRSDQLVQNNSELTQLREDISTDVGMDLISVSRNDLENINKHNNTQVYFKDGDNIYRCEVVFENNERNYYFKSGEDSVKLKKKS